LFFRTDFYPEDALLRFSLQEIEKNIFEAKKCLQKIFFLLSLQPLFEALTG